MNARKWWLLSGFFAPVLAIFFLLILFMGASTNHSSKISSAFDADGVVIFSDDVPMFQNIKGRGPIPDEVAQLAVGVAIKYRLLPSVIISQWAYESAWGTSLSARNDHNFFGITWFNDCPFPKGTARGIGGSEGGYYMKFPSTSASFNYYGYMVAKQSNFNACVGNKNPGECLLILGRGGYAAAGITESSAYYQGAMSIIKKHNLVEYDQVAIEKWGSSISGRKGAHGGGTKADISFLNQKLNQQVYNGECYGLTAYYVEKLGGPKIMGSGYMYAQRIGEDYDWGKYGWKVIINPKPSDLKRGDVVNWYAGGVLSPGSYGHTGIISSVSNGGHSFTTYEQNAGKGRVCATYQRTYEITRIRSIVRKVG